MPKEMKYPHCGENGSHRCLLGFNCPHGNDRASCEVCGDPVLPTNGPQSWWYAADLGPAFGACPHGTAYNSIAPCPACMMVVTARRLEVAVPAFPEGSLDRLSKAMDEIEFGTDRCPHGVVFTSLQPCAACVVGAQAVGHPEPSNCPHGHPIGCRPPCGACVRGEPTDKEYVGYAYRDAKPTNCPHATYRWGDEHVYCLACGVDVTNVPRETPLSFCPQCLANPCDCPERLAARDFAKRMRQLVAELARCTHLPLRVQANVRGAPWTGSWCGRCGASFSATSLKWSLPAGVRALVDLDAEARSLGADLSDDGATPPQSTTPPSEPKPPGA